MAKGASSKSGGKIASMTGFARGEGGNSNFSWSWELKSVNGRNLDQRYRMPSGHEELETRLRALVTKALARGNLQCSLTLNRVAGASGVAINQEILDQVVDAIGALDAKLDLGPSNAVGILSLRGVLEEQEIKESDDERTQRMQALEETFSEALTNLGVMRGEEGARLKVVVEGQLQNVENLLSEATDLAALQPEQLKARLKTQVEALLEASSGLTEDRLAQEAALLATKADIREELDRLGAHCRAAQDLLDEGRAVGRRLDFLCQEFNREANTICSKSSDKDLTRVGLEFKSVIEQMREQIQNIE